MTVDVSLLNQIAGVLGFCIAVASMVFTFFATRSKATDERFKTGSDRMDRHELRLQTLEQTVQGLPGRDDIHGIEIHVERLAGEMTRVAAVMEAQTKLMERLERVVTRHEDHLLKGNQR
ncbi:MULTISPECIES: DUF2730 family protein [Salipiger]|uniref:Putative DUF2730 protein n=1 Tax=Salipiger profundus TaxID=1229727 RepID=A0A1U7CZH7_9RHOB|nr:MULTISPECIES: DUF2730 family protein [Salipiger]ALF02068.1 hypothetical protein vBThpSP1_029 [Thiobacimonas phage vB_ThpS-P1]APX21291.1 putative DUF2730 protein [Salipiger profundus]GGA03498.1 hypothetical protein GCM10011326_13600 [Salipiger profundus]